MLSTLSGGEWTLSEIIGLQSRVEARSVVRVSFGNGLYGSTTFLAVSR